VVVGAGDAFSNLVSRNYGRAELTLIDFVKRANPDVTSVDVLKVGQHLKLPAFQPAALVERAEDARYRLHLITVWDTEVPAIAALRARVAQLGRQTYLVPVRLTSQETAYRLLVGDFADRGEAEAFYRDVRVPAASSTQLWR
jgi:hypothetical protein